MKRLLSVFLCVGLLFGLCSVGAVADAAPLEAEEELFQRFADEASLLRLFGAFADEGEHYSLDAVTSYVELKADFSPYGKGEDYGYVYEYYEVPAAIYESTVGRFFQLNDRLIADLRAYEGGLWNSETQTMAPLYDEKIDCYVFHGKGGLGDSTRYRTYAYHKDGEAENRYVVYFHELEPGYSPEWDDVCGEDFLLDFADDGEIYCYEITGLAKFVMEYGGTDVKFISSQPIETIPAPADWAVQESVEGFIAGPMLFGKVDGGKALWVCRFRDEPTSFEVPAEVYGLPVTGLSGQLFANPENLKSITLPEGLTRIGADAFYYCENLTEIHLPDSLETIGSWAFAATGITEVTIPAGVTEIGEYAFGNALTDIQVAAGNTAFAVENGVLYTADKSRILFGIPGKVGEGYDIPAGVTAIDRAAFSEVTGLGEITIPDSVTQMGEWAFALSDLTAITLSKGLKTVPYAAFVGCADLRQVTIPEGVETIDTMAFCETALDEVSLPSSLRRIEDNAFAGTPLTEVVLPEGVEYIGDEVFFGCENLERLVLPASLQTIVWHNRGETGALKEIRFMGTKAQWEEVTVLGDRELLESLMAFSDVLLGDVDGDGTITSTDARLTLQYYAGKIGEEDLDVAVADVDRDGVLTSTDARLILQYYAGKITEWPNQGEDTPSDEEACRVIVNGQELPESKYARLNREEEYAEIPLIAVFKALGAEIQQLNEHTLQITVKDITYVLDTQKGILTEPGYNQNFFVGPLTEPYEPYDETYGWKMVDGEFVVDSYAVRIVFLYHLRIATEIDYENGAVYIDWYPTYEPETYDGYRLIINGEEHEAGKHVLAHRTETGSYYIEVPLLAICEGFGAQVEWQENGLVHITFKGVTYELDTEEATLVEAGNEDSFFIAIAPGSDHGTVYRVVEDEFMIDNSSILLFTQTVMSVRVRTDYEEKTVIVEPFDFSQIRVNP